MAISAIGEGCHKQMEALLPQIMDGVIQYLQDPVCIMNKFVSLISFFKSFHIIRLYIHNLFSYSQVKSKQSRLIYEYEYIIFLINKIK